MARSRTSRMRLRRGLINIWSSLSMQAGLPIFWNSIWHERHGLLLSCQYGNIRIPDDGFQHCFGMVTQFLTAHVACRVDFPGEHLPSVKNSVDIRSDEVT